MGWGPSAIYTVTHFSGYKVEDLRISDIAYRKAEKGNPHFQTKICLEIRDRIEESTGKDPGFIYYDELEFIKIRNIPTANKRPPKMKAVSSRLKNSHTDTLTPRR